MNRFARSLLLALLLVGASAQAAESSAKQVRVDKRFGSGGWAAVPLPRGANVWESEMTCSAGRGESLVAVNYRNGSNRSKGSVLIKYDSKGRRKWTRRFAASTSPGSIHATRDRKWIVTSGSGKNQLLTRFLANGRRDASFGEGGTLPIPSDRIVWLSDGRFVATDLATVFTSDGKPDTSVNGNGRIQTPFPITHLAEADAGRLIVLGNGPEVKQIMKIERNGSQSADWNGGSPLTLEAPPETVWTNSVKKRDSSTKTVTAKQFRVNIDRVTPSHIDLWFTIEAVVEYDSERLGYKRGNLGYEIFVRHRLLLDGRVDARLRGVGWQYIDAVSDEEDLSEAGDDEASFQERILSDGRIAEASFIVGSEQDPGSWATIRISDKSGSFKAKGARIFKLNNLVFANFDFDQSGKNMLFCGVRRQSRIVLGRARL